MRSCRFWRRRRFALIVLGRRSRRRQRQRQRRSRRRQRHRQRHRLSQRHRQRQFHRQRLASRLRPLSPTLLTSTLWSRRSRSCLQHRGRHRLLLIRGRPRGHRRNSVGGRVRGRARGLRGVRLAVGAAAMLQGVQRSPRPRAPTMAMGAPRRRRAGSCETSARSSAALASASPSWRLLWLAWRAA